MAVHLRIGLHYEGAAAGVEVAIPTNKVCQGCDSSIETLTFYEKSLGLKHRLWFLKNFWGPLCTWCGRMSRIIYSHMSLPAIYEFLKKIACKTEFKNYSICYVSIRQEGRTQIGVEMLENRLGVLLQCLALVRPENIFRYMLLSEFVEHVVTWTLATCASSS
jgi:hypothetical protein